MPYAVPVHDHWHDHFLPLASLHLLRPAWEQGLPASQHAAIARSNDLLISRSSKRVSSVAQHGRNCFLTLFASIMQPFKAGSTKLREDTDCRMRLAQDATCHRCISIFFYSACHKISRCTWLEVRFALSTSAFCCAAKLLASPASSASF